MKTRDRSILATLVVPVFDEEKSLSRFIETVNRELASLPKFEFEFLFVNDGSSDKTLNELVFLSEKIPNISILDLSRNFGKEAALSAGLDYAEGDVVIPIDVDLQDPPSVIRTMVEKWREGFDVVLGKRSDRQTDTFSKRTWARIFYKVNNALTSTKIPEDVGDFRLLDRKVVLSLRELRESGRFMKGVFAWVGFSTCSVEYVRAARTQGKTKFNSLGLTKLAIDGITNFSVAPLRLSLFLGLAFSLFGFFYGLTLITRTIFLGDDLPGYPSIMVTVLFLGGVQLLALGVIGEYVGRTFIETKGRPVYLVNSIFRGKRSGS